MTDSIRVLRQRLQTALDSQDLTLRAVAADAGIDAGQLSRFLKRTDDQGLSPEKQADLIQSLAHMQKRDRVLPEEHVRVLAEKLRLEQLAIFVGAGISHLAPHAQGKPDRIPLWDGLKQAISQRFYPAEGDSFTNALDVFDAVAYEHGRESLVRGVAEVLDDSAFEPSEAHYAIKRLPFQAILTTNYDRLFERATGEVPIATEEGYSQRAGTTRPQRLFQIHGTLSHPHTLTRDDYRDWEAKHPRALHHLQDMLLNKTLLFVGYSLSDPHIDGLLNWIRRITAPQQKHLFAWMWRLTEPHQRLLAKRDRIEAYPINTVDDWTRAFQELTAAFDLEQQVAAVARPASERTIVISDSYSRSQYAAALRKLYSYANVSAIYQYGAGYARADVPLDEIFVLPDLEAVVARERSITSKDSLHEDDEAGLGDDAAEPRPASSPAVDSAEPVADDRTTLRAHLRRERQPDTTVRREPASQWRVAARKLLIIGEAGQGKSTLMQHWLLEDLKTWEHRNPEAPAATPILIRLSLWERSLAPADRLRTYLKQNLPHIAEVAPADAAAWVEGPIVWLLDGLDEIRDPVERANLRAEIAAVSQERPADRWVLTSRPSADPSHGLGTDWTVTRLSPLSDSQIRDVLAKWAVVLRVKENLELDVESLRQSLERDPGLRRLRANGLLLTMAIMFYKAHRRLPQDRWEFYDYADKALRDSWLLHRLGDAEQARRLMPGDYFEEFLDELGLYGMRQGIVSFTRGQLEEIARPILKRRGIKGQDLDHELGRLFSSAEDLVGVLAARGPTTFGFLHLTFQEFHAARALLKQFDSGRYTLGQKWDHPDWQEVWPMFVLGGADKHGHLELVCEAVLSHQHELDQHLFRPQRTLLSWLGLGKFPVCLMNLEDGGEDLRKYKHCREVLEWAHESLRPRNKWGLNLEHDLMSALEGLLSWEKPWPEELRDRNLQLLEVWHPHVRAAVIRALASQTNDPTVRAAVLARLVNEDEVEFVRSTAAGSLRGQAREWEVRMALLACLSSEEWMVVFGASAALSFQASETVICESLLVSLEDQSSVVRQAAAHALHHQAGTSAVREALLAHLGDEDVHVRQAVTMALSCQSGDSKMREALLIYVGDEDWRVRETATGVLSHDASNQTVRTTLLGRVEDTNGRVRRAVAGALSRQADVPSVRAALLARLGDQDAGVREAAVCALASQADDPTVRDAFVAHLLDENESVREAAAKALGGQADDATVREALLAGLTAQDWNDRLAAAIALSTWARDPEVRAALVTLLAREEDEHEFVRQAVADGLGEQVSDPAVRKLLLPHLVDEQTKVRLSVAKALSCQVDEPIVCEALMSRLKDRNSEVRQVAAKALSSQSRDPSVRAALLARLEDEDADVREAVAGALEQGIIAERHNIASSP